MNSGALGPAGGENGYGTEALCFQDPGSVVVVLTNGANPDVDAIAGRLVHVASA